MSRTPQVPCRLWWITACTSCQGMLRRRRPRTLADCGPRSTPNVRIHKPCATITLPKTRRPKAGQRCPNHRSGAPEANMEPPKAAVHTQSQPEVGIVTLACAAPGSMVIAVSFSEAGWPTYHGIGAHDTTPWIHQYVCLVRQTPSVDLAGQLSSTVTALSRLHERVLVGIDGPDGAGKTTLAGTLKTATTHVRALRASGHPCSATSAASCRPRATTSTASTTLCCETRASRPSWFRVHTEDNHVRPPRRRPGNITIAVPTRAVLIIGGVLL